MSDKDEDTITRKDLLQVNAILFVGVLVFVGILKDITLNSSIFLLELLIPIALITFLLSMFMFLFSILPTAQKVISSYLRRDRNGDKGKKNSNDIVTFMSRIVIGMTFLLVTVIVTIIILFVSLFT